MDKMPFSLFWQVELPFLEAVSELSPACPPNRGASPSRSWKWCVRFPEREREGEDERG